MYTIQLQYQLPLVWDHNVSDKGIGSTATQEQLVQLEQFDHGGGRQWSNYYPDRPVDQRYILAREITKIFNDFGILKKSIRAGDTSIKAFA